MIIRRKLFSKEEKQELRQIKIVNIIIQFETLINEIK